MKLLLMLNASLLLCAAVQAKFPADGLIKTAGLRRHSGEDRPDEG